MFVYMREIIRLIFKYSLKHSAQVLSWGRHAKQTDPCFNWVGPSPDLCCSLQLHGEAPSSSMVSFIAAHSSGGQWESSKCLFRITEAVFDDPRLMRS
jgi:hypothetical protein